MSDDFAAPDGGPDDPHSQTAYGDLALDSTCSNCKCEFPSGLKIHGTGENGELLCCQHCFFNPLGCRCKYGEFGVEETRPDY